MAHEVDRRVDDLLDRLDSLTERIDGLLELRSGNVQNVIHHTSGTTAWHIASVVSAFAALIFLIVTWGHFEREMNKHESLEQAQIDQLKAWSDIYRGKFAAIEKGK